jgi:hypothetical protein
MKTNYLPNLQRDFTCGLETGASEALDFPLLTVEDGQAKVEGNYKFKRGEQLYYDPINGIPVHMEITFKHSPEKPETMSKHQAAEILGERLKQDFINHCCSVIK